ncbi:MAG: hypothetical protein D6714_21480 [Bacteroidetes bacterium]|nr:MAG: hypothetical protein D6714_21480 [Bacteroidota bacterium]
MVLPAVSLEKTRLARETGYFIRTKEATTPGQKPPTIEADAKSGFQAVFPKKKFNTSRPKTTQNPDNHPLIA